MRLDSLRESLCTLIIFVQNYLNYDANLKHYKHIIVYLPSS